MKITIVQGAFLPVPALLGGAVEKMWFVLAKEFVKQGHSVIHISKKYKNLPKLETIDGVTHIRVRGFKTPTSGIHLKILDLFYSFNAKLVIPKPCDIIVTNTFWLPIIESSKSIVVDVQRMPKGQLRFYKNVGRFRANSSVVEKAIIKEISSKKTRDVITIPNPLPFNAEEQITIKNKKQSILYTGRVHEEKGLELLIRACNKLPEGWVLKILGPHTIEAGGSGKSFFSQLQKLATNSNIEFIDPVFDVDQLNNYYRDASIFVYPSLAEKGETFGLAPLEAMAWGCVPLVSNLDCFHDFIINGQNGVIFDHRERTPEKVLSEKILELTHDNGYRESLAIRALEVRQTHSIKSIATKFLKAFEDLVNEN